MKNGFDCNYFNSHNYIRFEFNNITNNHNNFTTLPQLNCSGGDGCYYSKYLTYMDCYNDELTEFGYSKWNCFPDKYFNHKIYPKIIVFGSFDLVCQDCTNNLNLSNQFNQFNYTDSEHVNKINLNIKKNINTCNLNYKMYELDLSNIYKLSNNNYNNKNYNNFILLCILTILVSFIIFIIGCKIFYWFYNYHHNKNNYHRNKNKYNKLTHKNFEIVSLINDTNNQNYYNSIEIV